MKVDFFGFYLKILVFYIDLLVIMRYNIVYQIKFNNPARRGKGVQMKELKNFEGLTIFGQLEVLQDVALIEEATTLSMAEKIARHENIKCYYDNDRKAWTYIDFEDIKCINYHATNNDYLNDIISCYCELFLINIYTCNGEYIIEYENDTAYICEFTDILHEVKEGLKADLKNLRDMWTETEYKYYEARAEFVEYAYEQEYIKHTMINSWK